MAELFANSGDPDQTPHSAASDLGLHCLRITLLRVSRLHWVIVQKPLKTYFISTVVALSIGTDRPQQNSVYPDQTPQYAASGQGLHSLYTSSTILDSSVGSKIDFSKC